MGIKLTVTSDEIIELTEHTITKCNKMLNEGSGKNEYLSRKILGIEITGKIDVYDKSKEILEVLKLSLWTKKVAHEKDSYRTILLEFADTNDNVYDTVTINKAFIVEFDEIFEEKKGMGEFRVMIRGLDNLEEAIRL